MSETRVCPGCGSDFHRRFAFGLEIDVCARCGGTFLDPGEAEAQGVSLEPLLQTYGATDDGVATRQCPAHGLPMRRLRVWRGDEDFAIERAECCSGIFLDSGEARPLADAARHAAEVASRARVEEVESSSGAVFVLPTDDPFAQAPAPPPALGMLRGIFAAEEGPIAPSSPIVPTEHVERTCPRCSRTYEAERTGAVEIDVCPGCGSMFLEYMDLEAKRVPTEALFGVRREGTRVIGRSEVACPACAEGMVSIEIATLMGPIVIDRAECCGGVFLDGGEHEPFVRAARLARSEIADAAFAERGRPRSEAVNAAAAAWPAIERAEEIEERARRLAARVATARAIAGFFDQWARSSRRRRRSQPR